MVTVRNFFFLLYCVFFDFFNFTFSKLDLKRKNLKDQEVEIYKNYRKIKFNNFINELFFKKSIKDIDFISTILVYIKSKKLFNKQNIFRSYFRILATKSGFYFNFNSFSKKNSFFYFFKNSIFSGFKFLWFNLKFWIVIVLMCFVMYFVLVVRALPFNKIIFSWIGIIMFCYWLISGFVFFIKKYQFGKYTSAIQRFWRRSYILFWLIEAATFSVFLFLTINASQESFYMFDQISFYKTHLYSWKFFLLKLFPIVILILLTYFMLVSLKWNLFSKNIFFIVFITFNLTYIVWLEFYQFIHILNFYGNFNWIYDLDEHIWNLELEPRRTRIVNHYIMLLFILKFWHIVFIYGFWIFFILRSLEINRIRYPLLAANFQNFIILYIFAWVFMYPWFKFFFKNFLYSPYYWFYVNNRRLFFRVLFNDFKLIYYGLVDYFEFSKMRFLNYFNYSFFYWNLASFDNDFELFRKNIIKNHVIKSL